MKATAYLGPNIVRTIDTGTPHLSDAEVLVRIHAAGICGTDISIAGGHHPRAKAPLILGHEFAGEVVEIKPDPVSTHIRIGDKVTVYPLISCGQCWSCRNGHEHVCRTLRMIGIDFDGGMAEYAKIPLDHTYKLPKTLSYEMGALIEPLAVGVHSVNMAGIESTDFAVVMGAGPIGIIVAVSLRNAGANKIFVTDINRFRLRLAEEFGFETLNAGSNTN